jgi:hypothetical protein
VQVAATWNRGAGICLVNVALCDLDVLGDHALAICTCSKKILDNLASNNIASCIYFQSPVLDMTQPPGRVWLLIFPESLAGTGSRTSLAGSCICRSTRIHLVACTRFFKLEVGRSRPHLETKYYVCNYVELDCDEFAWLHHKYIYAWELRIENLPCHGGALHIFRGHDRRHRGL